MSLTCEHARPLLSAYFDRELDVANSLAVEAHVRDCGACAVTLERHAAVRTALADAPLVYAPPRDLEDRVRRATRRESRLPAPVAVPWRRWAAVPLAAMLAAALAWSLASPRGGAAGEDAVAAELVSGHVRSLMADHLVDVATSDQHMVKPWFNGRIDFAPPVADFTAGGFPLVGGRVDYIGGRPVAVLVYKARQHLVNVFVWPDAAEGDQAPHALVREGFHLLQWQQSGLTFWAVSDVNPDDLQRLAQLFRTAT